MTPGTLADIHLVGGRATHPRSIGLVPPQGAELRQWKLNSMKSKCDFQGHSHVYWCCPPGTFRKATAHFENAANICQCSATACVHFFPAQPFQRCLLHGRPSGTGDIKFEGVASWGEIFKNGINSVLTTCKRFHQACVLLLDEPVCPRGKFSKFSNLSGLHSTHWFLSQSHLEQLQ